MINTVTFPGLGLEFELNRVAFTVLGHDVYWYGVIIACGFLLAVLYAYWKAPAYQMDREAIFDLLLYAVPLCIIGARAYYVIFYLSLYVDPDGSFNWAKAIAIWDGGLAIYGAILMAILVVVVFCKVRKQNFWDYADLGSLGVMIGQLVGRWGNFINVEAYGGLTDAPWRMCSPTIAAWLWDQGQITAVEDYEAILNGTLGVHPTFFYESAWNLLGFVILALIARRGRRVKGQTFAGYLIWYGLGRAVIEGMRTDSLYFFSTGIRTSQMVGVISVIAGIVLLAVRLKTGEAPAAVPVEGVPVEGVPARDGTAETPVPTEEVPAETVLTEDTPAEAVPAAEEQKEEGKNGDPD